MLSSFRENNHLPVNFLWFHLLGWALCRGGGGGGGGVRGLAGKFHAVRFAPPPLSMGISLRLKGQSRSTDRDRQIDVDYIMIW